jgi:hypothetical protein
MSIDTPQKNTSPARAAKPKWFPFAVAAGAVAVGALALGVVVMAGGDDDSPTANTPAPTVPAPTDPPTTAPPTTIGKVPAVVDRPPGLDPAPAPSDPLMMMCLEFSPESLTPAPVAFDGIVTAIDGNNVTFEVQQWFRGGSGDILVTDGAYMVGDNVALIGGPQAEIGQRYLVAAELYSDAVRPGSCGWVQLYSEDLAATYAQAFAG